MLNRREWLRSATTAAGAAFAGAALGSAALAPGAAAAPSARSLLRALRRQDMLMRAVPSTGEMLPVVGLGSSATFSRMARDGETDGLRDVLSAFVENGGSVFDTAPSYGRDHAAERVAGSLAAELGISDSIFWATKVNVAGRGGGSADPDAARAQIERSFEYIGVPVIDCIQVHNLGDMPVQMAIIEELKQEGRIRYTGVTSTSKGQYEALVRAMRDYPVDFIGIDYAVDNRSAADEILPVARGEGIAVLVYVPFGRTRLWARVGDREVPEWAREFGADTWARFFIKFAAAHPDVTCVTPATSNPEHMIDNLGAGLGRMPDEDEQQRMIELVDALPPAPRRRG